MTDLADGESCEMKGSGRKPYVLKNTGGVYSCSCPAWRNQSAPIESRTCKHLRKLRGDAAETARIGGALPARRPPEAKPDAPPLLLAHSWDSATDLAGWWMSEKLDGVRAYWTGKAFLSRQGNEFHAPDWFVAGLPEIPLDGELWMDRGAFQKTVSIVRRQDRSEHWKSLRFVVFDAPGHDAVFEQRLAAVRDALQSGGQEFATPLEHERCSGEAHLRERLAEIESLGGEGLMLREPASSYEVGRSTTLLKVKSFHDAEAVVVGHSPGKGRHKGRVGALVARLADGTEFSVGTGLSDAQRTDPPAVGSTITFRHQEMTDGGVPRFPSFLRVAALASAHDDLNPVESSAPPSRAAEAVTPGDAWYFELRDEKSAKFWEVTASVLDVTVRYGRIGSAGQSRTKSFADAAKAIAHRDKLVREKTGRGYAKATPPDHGGSPRADS